MKINLDKDWELYKAGKTCCMCFETKGLYTLKQLRDLEDTTPSVKMQSILLLQEGNTSPSSPSRKKRQPIEGGCIGDSLAPSDIPQECSGQANVAAKEDTSDSTLPEDLKSKLDVVDSVCE